MEFLSFMGECVLGLGALFLLFSGLCAAQDLIRPTNDGVPFVNFVYMLTLVLLGLACEFFFMDTVSTSSICLVSLQSVLLCTDSYCMFTKAIIVLLTVGSLVLAHEINKKTQLDAVEFYFVYVLSVLGLCILVSAETFLVLFLGLELQSFGAYVLANRFVPSFFSTEAGIKYFVMGAVSSLVLLYGLAMLTLSFGTFGIKETLLEFVCSPTWAWLSQFNFCIGFAFVLGGLFFKLTIAPFHLWAADVYEGVPVSVGIFFACVPKIGLLIALSKFLVLLPAPATLLRAGLDLGLLSLIIGSFLALQQHRLKRLLAYSGITQMGYALLALSSGLSDSLCMAHFFVLFYSITVLVIWGGLACLSVEPERPSAFYLTQLLGLGRSNPSLSWCLALAFFSLAGLPPLAGFYIKFFVITPLAHAGLYVILCCAVLNGVVTAVYYIRMTKLMSFDRTEFWVLRISPTKAQVSVILVCACLVIFYMFAPEGLLLLSQETLCL